MSIPPKALAAAHRARTIAAIARTRATVPLQTATSHDALWKIANLLDAAATAFETEHPDTFNGITITNTVPVDAWLALADAERIAAANPTLGFPPMFGQYVTAVVYGSEIELPPSLLPGGPVLIAKEGDLFARLFAVHGHLRVTTGEEITTALLEAAFTLHWKHALLAASERVSAARPCNRPTVPAVVEIPAPATATALSRAHAEHGPTVTYGLKDRRLPCFSSEHPAPHTAVRMVSHLGARIPTCEQHREAAAVAARELYDLHG
ncbi:hypothetical protein [Streptomyces sp. SP18BB07]|uniref:hypothetical protein n=1 Tax=Streptomyces sp. SP18BB07 TaxID=3002522 RepID=UPI002E772335|nr:hypothetical protein [Streptomyces sp. SP18BB07]MEE1764472.1 hypothetical protein [Streptomyces sp. SP18BB07]